MSSFPLTVAPVVATVDGGSRCREVCGSYLIHLHRRGHPADFGDDESGELDSICRGNRKLNRVRGAKSNVLSNANEHCSAIGST
jgi:hypothetical protein